MKSNELKIAFPNDWVLHAVRDVDTAPGRTNVEILVVRWLKPNGQQPSQPFIIDASEAPGVFRSLAAFAEIE
jgi:hypothetical protein